MIEINHAPRAEQDRDAWFLYYGQKSTTDWKDAEIEALGRDGWELISAVPLEGGRVKEAAAVHWAVTYSYAIVLWFKREA